MLVLAVFWIIGSTGVDWCEGVIGVMSWVSPVWLVGVIEIGFSSLFCFFFGEWVMRWMILSIFLFTCSWDFFLAGVDMKAVGSFEVNIFIGLPCEESEIRLITSIDLFCSNFEVSSWILGELEILRWCSFALFNFDWAIAASFDFLSKSLLGFVDLFWGCCFLFRWDVLRLFGPGVSKW